MTHEGTTYYFEVAKKTRKEFRDALAEGLGDNRRIVGLQFVDEDGKQCAMEKRALNAGTAFVDVWNVAADITSRYVFFYCFASKSRGDKHYRFGASFKLA